MKNCIYLFFLIISYNGFGQCTLDISHTYTSSETCVGADGTATVYPQGGSGNYSYSWSPAGNTQLIWGLSSGIYTVTVTDNSTQCVASVSMEVFDACNGGGAACVTTSSIDSVICQGSSFTYADGTISNNIQTNVSYTSTLVGQSAAGCDSVITENLTIVASSTGTDIQSACGSYTWIDGNTYTSSNNTATWIETNAAGCDSLVTLDLTITPLPDNNVTQTGALLEADQTGGATYQWLDCDNSNATMNGETNQSYSPATTGNYAVEVTLNGCTDTSSCFLVDYTGIEELLMGEKELVKIVDLMGREVPFEKNKVLIYVFSDGTTERIFEFE